MPLFAPVLNFPGISLGLFQGEQPGKTSNASQQVKTVTNPPDKTGANTKVNAPEIIKKETSSTDRINLVISQLRANQSNAQEVNNKLLSLKEKIDNVSNQTTKGILRYSEAKGLYFSKTFKIGEVLGLRDAGAAKFEKEIHGLDLEFGKVTNKKNVISEIDKKLSFQKLQLEFLQSSIEKQEEHLSTEQYPMNDLSLNSSNEMIEATTALHDQDDSTGDELSVWPERDPNNKFENHLHSIISNHLESGNEEFDLAELYKTYTSNSPENLEEQNTPPRSDTAGNPDRQVKPTPLKRTINHKPVEQKTTDDHSVPLLPRVQRSVSAANPDSKPVPVPRKGAAQNNLMRTHSDPSSNPKEITEGHVKTLKEFWEKQNPSDSTGQPAKR